MAPMPLRLALFAVLLLAAVAPAAEAGVEVAPTAPFAAVGAGTLTYVADGPALASSSLVRQGTITLAAKDGPPLVVQCVGVPRPAARCARAIGGRGVQRLLVLRPVRFLYEGEDFRLVVSTRAGFRMLVVGSGRVTVRGRGRWSLGGPAQSYDGATRVQLP